jgi:hypothetical protein
MRLPRIVCRAAVVLAPMIVGLACRPGPPTPESTSAPVVFGERALPVAEVPVEPLDPITPGECPAEVGDVPTAFFEERVLVRLPVGVDDSNLVEVGHSLARSTGAIESIDCRPEAASGALITLAALTLHADQPVLALEAVRDQALAEFGYPAGYAILEGVRDPEQRRGMWVVESIADDRSTRRALVVLKSSSGLMIALVLETPRDTWAVLVDSFVESGTRMLVVP